MSVSFERFTTAQYLALTATDAIVTAARYRHETEAIVYENNWKEANFLKY
jgi:hypothetical protein